MPMITLLAFLSLTFGAGTSLALCEQWDNGACVKGPLTKLAHSMRENTHKAQSATCDKVCEEACPKCNLCDYCLFCGIYHDEACLEVPYFENSDTCAVLKTDSCCKLCEVQCQNPQGVCGAQGYCKKNNNANASGVDLLTHCVEQTTSEQCAPCKKP